MSMRVLMEKNSMMVYTQKEKQRINGSHIQVTVQNFKG